MVAAGVRPGPRSPRRRRGLLAGAPVPARGHARPGPTPRSAGRVAAVARCPQRSRPSAPRRLSRQETLPGVAARSALMSRRSAGWRPVTGVPRPRARYGWVRAFQADLPHPSTQRQGIVPPPPPGTPLPDRPSLPAPLPAQVAAQVQRPGRPRRPRRLAQPQAPARQAQVRQPPRAAHRPTLAQVHPRLNASAAGPSRPEWMARTRPRWTAAGPPSPRAAPVAYPPRQWRTTPIARQRRPL